MTWTPSKADRADYGRKMREIDQYCKDHNIDKSRRGDSYYFAIGETNYRISNHSVDASDRGMFAMDGCVQVRDSYHQDRARVEILAGKTRIMEIHQALLAGKQLDNRGREIASGRKETA